MKLTCPFCKTDYAAKVPGGRRTECCLCGCAWMPPRRSNVLLIWAASAAMVLAAIIFAVAAAIKYTPAAAPKGPLAIEKVKVQPAAGEGAWVVSGRIANLSGRIFGVPDLMLIVRNDNGDVVFSQRMLPPMPILDIGESAAFSHPVPELPDDARRVTVEFRK